MLLHFFWSFDVRGYLSGYLPGYLPGYLLGYLPWAAIHQGQGGRVPPNKNYGGDKDANVPPNNKGCVPPNQGMCPPLSVVSAPPRMTGPPQYLAWGGQGIKCPPQ